VTRQLHVRDEAELDVIDAVAWYEEQRTSLGVEFLIELDAALQRMVQSPFQFPQIKNNVRRALLHRFPYSVYFLAGEEIVDVIAILHQHRDPRTWEQRSTN
jgi:plasmid stabilization system protein ParE